MNKFNIWDVVFWIINYSFVECTIVAIHKKNENIVYDVIANGYTYHMYDYELGKTKEELKIDLWNKIKYLQGILDSLQ